MPKRERGIYNIFMHMAYSATHKTGPIVVYPSSQIQFHAVNLQFDGFRFISEVLTPLSNPLTAKTTFLATDPEYPPVLAVAQK